ncbi:MAG: FAD-dependent oxidoreductase [Candidatus Thermoplasmatota archaeon]|jgi:NAD(P)H-flavin reductase|nr:FAD-dependent oxidoreductase [Candidatus Thermoplasmatota archaeon]MCL5963094.1 FAD-dependent oxidoreductase [Candidatus Thermoplasmatota archaeon]
MQLKYSVKVIENVTDTESTYLLRLERGASWPFDYDPGMFITVFIPRNEKPPLTRSYSIASPPSQKGYLELCIKRVEGGFGSNYLCDRKPGDVLDITKPLGVFTLKETGHKNILFLATGTGIAPFKSMIESIYENKLKNKQLWLFFGVRTQKDIIYRHRMEELAGITKDYFHYIVSLSREPLDSNWKGERGHIEDIIKKYIPDVNDTDAYICGLPVMVNETVALLEKLGIPEKYIFKERY